jgi:hypothetical protein
MLGRGFVVLAKVWFRSGCAVVEHSTQYRTIKGSNPATGTHPERVNVEENFGTIVHLL